MGTVIKYLLARFFFGQVGRRLRIRRTFKTTDGKEFVRIEVVKNQSVIDAYLKFNKDKNVKYCIFVNYFVRNCVLLVRYSVGA